MAEKHLGPGFEVHGGGLDLRFPHHENELAQSRGAGRPFARTWMHNGLIELGAEKMSKSIGNIVSLREALDRWGREAILVFFLGAHYRSPLEYSDITMQAARAQADDFRRPSDDEQQLVFTRSLGASSTPSARATPAWTAATSSGDSGLVRARPSTSAANTGRSDG